MSASWNLLKNTLNQLDASWDGLSLVLDFLLKAARKQDKQSIALYRQLHKDKMDAILSANRVVQALVGLRSSLTVQEQCEWEKRQILIDSKKEHCLAQLAVCVKELQTQSHLVQEEMNALSKARKNLSPALSNVPDSRYLDLNT